MFNCACFTKNYGEITNYEPEKIESGVFLQCDEQNCTEKATQKATIDYGSIKINLALCEKHSKYVDLKLEMSKLREIPTAKVRLEVHNGNVNRWIMDECPYCRNQHTHSAGIVGKDDPYEHLGKQQAQCEEPYLLKADSLGGYILEEDTDKGTEVQKHAEFLLESLQGPNEHYLHETCEFLQFYGHYAKKDYSDLEAILRHCESLQAVEE